MLLYRIGINKRISKPLVTIYGTQLDYLTSQNKIVILFDTFFFLIQIFRDNFLFEREKSILMITLISSEDVSSIS